MANKLYSFWRPIAYKGWWSALLAALVICLSLLYWHKGEKTTGFWNDAWEISDPVAGIMTFVTTLVIFYLQARQQWIEALEKRLDVDFLYHGVLIGEIRGAYLSGESDIRAWSQSLGAQLFAQKFLHFDFVIEESNKVVYTAEKSFINQYSATIYLTKDPRISSAQEDTATEKPSDDRRDSKQPKQVAAPALAKSHIERAEVYRWMRKK